MVRVSEADLADLTEILESITKKLDRYQEIDLIDLAARMKSVAKHCDTIDKYTKEYVKRKLGDMDGEVKGKIFEAQLRMTPYSRFIATLLKEAMPKVYAKYLDTGTEPRVSYRTR